MSLFVYDIALTVDIRHFSGFVYKRSCVVISIFNVSGFTRKLDTVNRYRTFFISNGNKLSLFVIFRFCKSGKKLTV